MDDMADLASPMRSSDVRVESLLSSLTLEQHKLLCNLSDLSSREQAMLGSEMIRDACGRVTAAERFDSADDDKRNACRYKRMRMDEPASSNSIDDTGTGPAFEAIGERAVLHRYITQPALDVIRKRIQELPASEQEDALVCAMRRFCACLQPMSSVVLSGHVLEGLPARLVGCAPPGGSPEVYNVEVMAGGGQAGSPLGTGLACPLLIRVEPKHFRPAPLESDLRDEMHEAIPADHEAEAWFAERVLVSEMMFRAEKRMGASFGPGRP